MSPRPNALGGEFECPDELNGLRVLVVDDDSDTAELVVRLLSRCGAKARAATSVDRALQEVAADKPDVIISDIGMPDRDGYDFIHSLRAYPREAGGRIAAAALTAYATAEDRNRTLRAGFQVHVAKPVDPAELILVVARLSRMTVP